VDYLLASLLAKRRTGSERRKKSCFDDSYFWKKNKKMANYLYLPIFNNFRTRKSFFSQACHLSNDISFLRFHLKI